MVIIMKKFLITIVIALIIGAGLGIYSYSKFKDDETIPVVKSSRPTMYTVLL